LFCKDEKETEEQFSGTAAARMQRQAKHQQLKLAPSSHPSAERPSPPAPSDRLQRQRVKHTTSQVATQSFTDQKNSHLAEKRKANNN
jgi:hypothetical protein